MNKRLLSTLGFALFLAACGGTTGLYGSGGYTTPAPSAPASNQGTYARATAAPSVATPAPTATAAPVVAPASVLARSSALGTILTNPAGLTLYYFLPERGGRIVCASSACTTYWPPSFVSNGSPTAGAGVTGSLSIIMRAGGDQITYSKWPLYTFAGDSAAGQTNGQGVVGFGGKWLAATPGLQP